MSVFDNRGQLLGVVSERHAAWRNRWDLIPADDIRSASSVSRVLRDMPSRHIVQSSSLIEPPYHSSAEAISEYQMLQARYAYVPFIADSHDSVLTKLREWCQTDTTCSISVLTGQGGSGKTRLAAELCATLLSEKDASWQAGFARTDTNRAWGEFLPDRPTLVVFDYSERSSVRDYVNQWVQHLVGERAVAPKVRILLVSRNTGDWLNALNLQSNGVIKKLRSTGIEDDLRYNSLDGNSGLSRDQRHKHADVAYTRFREFGASDEAREQLHYFVDDDAIDSPLLIHIAALLAAQGASLPTRSVADQPNDSELREELLEHFLHRERHKRWNNHPALSRTPTVPVAESDDALHAVAIATLICPDVDEFEDYLCVSPLWPNDDVTAVDRREAAKAVHELYPGPIRFDEDQRPIRTIAPLEPDLISEYLIASLNKEHSLKPITDELMRQDLRTPHRARMLHVGDLVANHYPEAAEAFTSSVDQTIRHAAGEFDDSDSTALQLLVKHFDHIVRTALNESARTAKTDSIGALNTAIIRHSEHPDLAEAAAHLDVVVPGRPSSRQHADLFLHISQLEVIYFKSQYSQVSPNSDYARSLENLGVGLSNLGRHEEAHPHRQRAVELYEHLAATNPAHTPDLAHSLKSLGIGLEHLGRHKEAHRCFQRSQEVQGQS